MKECGKVNGTGLRIFQNKQLQKIYQRLYAFFYSLISSHQLTINLYSLSIKQIIIHLTFPSFLIQDSMQPLSARKQLRVQTNDAIDKTFKQYAKTISQSIQKLNSFTDNLQNKVNTLLKAQQTQFVTSYKNHMAKIKDQLTQMNHKLAQYEQKIDYYENEGRLSHYIKKVNFMEVEQIKLYEEIKAKDKKIKELQFDIEMRKKLQKQSDEKIKIMYRKRIEEQQQTDRSTEKSSILKRQTSQTYLDMSPTNKHLSSIQTFTTEIPSYHYNRKTKLNLSNSKERQLTKLITDDDQKSALYKSHEYINSLEKDGLNLNKQNELKEMRIVALEKQVHHLKVQNKKLLLFNSKYANNLSQLGEFFLKTVEQLKKNIASKRKVKNDINFEEFSKQDKLVVLATLLSNETAIMLLYENIFKPKPNKNRAQSVLEKSYGSKNHPEPIKSQRQIQEVMINPEGSMPFAGKLVFPSLKSRRLIH